VKKKYSMKNYTKEQVDYVKEHYHNEQTLKIANDLNLEMEEVSYIAKNKKLKKDEGFKYARRDSSLTLRQREFILKNYSTMKNSEIIDKIGVTYEQIRQFANNNKLSKESGFRENEHTKKQEQYVIDNYSSKQTFDMVGKFGLTHSSIMSIAHKYGLKKDKDLKIITFNNKKEGSLTFEQKQFIIENYATMKNNKICEILGISKDSLHSYSQDRKLRKTPQVSKRYNHYYEDLISKRDRKDYNVNNYLNNKKEPTVSEDLLYKSKYGKYKVNENYFDDINNEWKAYWLGFLYADGCNTTDKKSGTKNVNRLGLGLASVDREHLQNFLNSLQSDSIIKDYTSHLNGKEYYNSKINICNQHICQTLKEKGCVPNKSLILTFPNETILPKHLRRHFIRGYFDGDGCIHINKEKGNVNLNFVGTKEFLSVLQDILCEEIGLDKTSIHENNRGSKAYSFAYGGYADVESIYKYLYKDCNIYLQRKLDKFDILYCLD